MNRTLATMPLLRRALSYLTDAVRGVRQAPVEVLATLCTAISFSVSMEIGDEAMRSFAEIAVSCVLLFGVAWSGTLLHALGVWDARRRWIVTIIGAVVVAFYAILHLDFEHEAEAWRAVMLVLAGVLWLFAVPAFGAPKGTAVERMRRVNGRVVLRIIGALLYGVALFTGLALALRAIDVLFELKLQSELYGHVWSAIFFVLVPWIVLGGLQDYVRPEAEASGVAQVAHRIVLYLVPPLLALYFVILYAYVVRIAITSEIPKNLVSPMVLAAGGLAALALVIFDPAPGRGPLARALRLTPALFLPLAPLGVWALIVRIDQYGWTEFRMLRVIAVVALALLAVGACVQLVRRRTFPLHIFPLLLAGTLVFAAIGPWSVLAVSRRSQESRLTSALATLNIPLEDPAYRAPPDTARTMVSASTYEQIRASSQYLAGHFGADALPPVLRGRVRGEEARWMDYAAELGLRPDAVVEGRSFGAGGSLPYNVPIDLDDEVGYRVQWTPRRAPDGRVMPDVANGSNIVMRASVAVLHVGGRVLQADLAKLIASLSARTGVSGRGEGLTPEEAVVAVVDSAGASVGRLVLLDLWVETDSVGTHVGRLDGLVLLRK